MSSLTFAKFYVIISSYEDIYGRYCFQWCNNDHFHPQLSFIVCKTKSTSFPVASNKQTRPRFLELTNFITCLPPDKARDIAFSHRSLSACKDGGYREKGQ